MSKGMGGINRKVPLSVVSIAALLAIGIPFKISTDLEHYTGTGNSVFQFQTAIFLGLLILSMLGVSQVRLMEDSLLKSLLYLVMGFATFWIMGAAYHNYFFLTETVNPNYGIFIRDFLPITILALTNAATVLVALIDSRKNGMLFGTMGMGVVIFSVVFTEITYSTWILLTLLILAILWASIPIVWVKILAEYIDYKVPCSKRLPRILKATIFTMPLFFVVGFLTRYLYSGYISVPFFSPEITAAISLPVSTAFLYIFINGMVIISIFRIFDLTLQVFNFKKKIGSDGSIRYIHTEQMKIPVTRLDFDPFEDIIKEMRQFKKDFGKGKINRFVTAQKIGAFREKVDLIYAKHKRGSKDIALKLLRQIEKESEFAYK